MLQATQELSTAQSVDDGRNFSSVECEPQGARSGYEICI